MRYVLQLAVMLIDLALLVACIMLLRMLHPLVAVPMVLLTFSTWRDQGGLLAWRPGSVHTFLDNAKALGL